MQDKKTPQQHRRLERGQSLIEMTAGFLFLAVLVSGLLDLGRLYFIYIALEDSVGEGAIYLSINPRCPRAGGSCTATGNAEWRVLNAAGDPGSDGLLDWDLITDLDFFPQEDGNGIFVRNPGVGETVTVEVEYRYTLITPMLSDMVGDDGINLTVRAQQTVLMQPAP
jgi:hypothetical protein